MFEFNPDGSIKVPKQYEDKKRLESERMTNRRCISIKKDVVSVRPPKTCKLSIELSKAFMDNSFIMNTFNEFKKSSETPSKIVQVSDKEFVIEIGSDFRRCSDCNKIVSRFREFLSGNVILDKGTCTMKEREFCFEDYFD